MNERAEDHHGALQVIMLAQDVPRPVYLSGWSRAEGVEVIHFGGSSVFLPAAYCGPGR